MGSPGEEDMAAYGDWTVLAMATSPLEPAPGVGVAVTRTSSLQPPSGR